MPSPPPFPNISVQRSDFHVGGFIWGALHATIIFMSLKQRNGTTSPADVSKNRGEVLVTFGPWVSVMFHARYSSLGTDVVLKGSWGGRPGEDRSPTLRCFEGNTNPTRL